jgi:hypothetical protein
LVLGKHDFRSDLSGVFGDQSAVEPRGGLLAEFLSVEDMPSAITIASSAMCEDIRPHMVAPGFLENPEVCRWLNGVEPAWTMLEFNSLNPRHL